MDYGGRFIDAAIQLQAGKTLEYGPSKKVAKLPENAGIDATKTIFKQVCRCHYITSLVTDWSIVTPCHQDYLQIHSKRGCVVLTLF